MRELPYLVQCSCGWSVPAATYQIAQKWRTHHLETQPPAHSPLSDGKRHTLTIGKVDGKVATL